MFEWRLDTNELVAGCWGRAIADLAISKWFEVLGEGRTCLFPACVSLGYITIGKEANINGDQVDYH